MTSGVLHADEPVAAQAVPKWEVEIPVSIIDGTSPEPTPESTPIDFTELSSRTKRMDVVQSPEMSDLPPVTGTINVTVQLVGDPNLPNPPPPLPALPPDDPAVVARLEELLQKYRGTTLLFVSATTYDHHRTLLHIYPNGKVDQEVTAWSNLDFNHFCGFSTYRVRDGVDGSFHDFGLLMGIGNFDTARMRALMERHGQAYQAPEIPALPDLSIAGPAFDVIKGEADSPAMDTLEQIHDLYRKEGVRMAAASLAREQARAERKAYLLANPPQPSDVTVRFWRKTKPQAPSQSEVPAP